MSGKGSKQRPFDRAKFNENFDRIFGNQAKEPSKPDCDHGQFITRFNDYKFRTEAKCTKCGHEWVIHR